MITPYFPPNIGGIENHVYELVRRIKKHWEIVVLTTSKRYKRAKIKPNILIKAHQAGLSPMNNPFAPGMALSGAQERPSLVHVHGIYQVTCIIGWIIAGITGCPSIISMHGRPHYSTWIKSTIQRIYEYAILPLILKRYDIVIALTDIDKSFLISIGINQEKIIIIPNGVDSKYWSQDAPSNSYKMRNNRSLLFVGALIERKNPEVLLEPFHILKEKNLLDDLIIVGKGPLKDVLLDKCKSMGIEDYVIFLDGLSRTELRNLYGAAEVVVHPSLMEGLPTIVLEVMSMKSLIVSSNIPAVRNLIQHEDNGFMFDLKKPEGLLEVLQNVLSLSYEEKQRIMNNARTTIIETYDWFVVAANIENVYRRILSNRK